MDLRETICFPVFHLVRDENYQDLTWNTLGEMISYLAL